MNIQATKLLGERPVMKLSCNLLCSRLQSRLYGRIGWQARMLKPLWAVLLAVNKSQAGEQTGMLYLEMPPVEASHLVLWMPFGAFSRECEAEGAVPGQDLQGQIGCSLLYSTLFGRKKPRASKILTELLLLCVLVLLGLIALAFWKGGSLLPTW